MALVKVAVYGTVGKSVSLNPKATEGATVGTNLFLPDGSVATQGTLAAFLGVTTAVSGVAHHRLLQGLTLGDDHPQYTRKDTLTTRGDLYVRDATTVTRLAKGSTSQFLQSGATDPAWQTISPVITLSTDLSGSTTLTNLTNGTLAATIVANAVTDGKLRQSAGLSVIGRSANTTGNVADVTAASDSQVLRRSGTSIGFGAVDLSAANAITGDLPFSNLAQGSALSVLGVTGNTTADLASIASSGSLDILRRSGSAVGFGTIDHTYISDFSSAVPQPANPTASAGLTAVNGSSITFMRSDGAPALNQNIAPTWTAQHLFKVGSASSPGIAFAGSPTTGIYSSLADNLNFVAGGTNAIQFNSTIASFFINGQFPNGSSTVAGLGFNAEPGMGLYRISAGNLGITVATVNVMQVQSNAFQFLCQAQAQPGSAGSPSLSFYTDTDTGRYSIGANNIGDAVGGVLLVDYSANRVAYSAPVQLPNSTVSGLVAAGTAGAGALAFVTDATQTAILGLGLTVVGGGANKVPVYSDGTNWIII